jgi:hypothetical protein
MAYATFQQTVETVDGKPSAISAVATKVELWYAKRVPKAMYEQAMDAGNAEAQKHLCN